MLEEVKQENGTWSLVAQFVTRSIDQSDGTVPTDNINIAAVVQFDERPGSRIGLLSNQHASGFASSFLPRE
jgi:hypothetical protein